MRPPKVFSQKENEARRASSSMTLFFTKIFPIKTGHFDLIE